MEPTMIEKRQMILLGFSFFGDPFRISGGWTEENEIGRLWKRYMAFLTKHHQCIKHVKNDAVMYEVHVEHEETAQTGEHEVFVGLEAEKLEDVPVEISVKILPPTTYDHIVKEWELAREQLKAVLEEMPAAKFEETLIFPWGPRGTIAQIVAILADHEEEHAEEIRQLKAAST